MNDINETYPPHECGDLAYRKDGRLCCCVCGYVQPNLPEDEEAI